MHETPTLEKTFIVSARRVYTTYLPRFLLMAMLENVAHAIAERHFAKVAKASAPLALASSAAVVTVAATSAASGKYAGANAATCTSGTSAGTAAVGAFDVRLQVLTPPHPHHTDEDSGSLKCCNEDNTPAATTTTASPTSGAVAATPTVRQARSVTTAFMFELGCMAHSVIIGGCERGAHVRAGAVNRGPLMYVPYVGALSSYYACVLTPPVQRAQGRAYSIRLLL